MRPPPSALLLFAITLLTFSPVALAQETEEESPSLALSTDQSAPWQRFALTMDIIAPIWGEYTLSLHAMPSRFAGARVSGGFRSGETRTLIGSAWVDVRPFGRSFDGLLLTLGVTYEEGAERLFGGGAELGYAFTWRSLLFEASAGVLWNPRDEWAPRARLAAGLAF
ncbi:MAG: hypothetical protein ACI9KE_006505 [Polyangiales bacterium]|jgi:hypothetical protein